MSSSPCRHPTPAPGRPPVKLRQPRAFPAPLPQMERRPPTPDYRFGGQPPQGRPCTCIMTPGDPAPSFSQAWLPLRPGRAGDTHVWALRPQGPAWRRAHSRDRTPTHSRGGTLTHSRAWPGFGGVTEWWMMHISVLQVFQEEMLASGPMEVWDAQRKRPTCLSVSPVSLSECPWVSPTLAE